MECVIKNHVYDQFFTELPETQRHYTKTLNQCAGCAFDLGYAHGLEGVPHNNQLQKLNTIDIKAAGGTVKDPINAYDLGYATGDKVRRSGRQKKKWWSWFSFLWSWWKK
jgi:hypothetical protein